MIEAYKSDKGSTRENNQDWIDIAMNINNDKLYILCDGMGGYKGGEVASLECAKFIKNRFEESSYSDIEEAKTWLYNAIVEANKKIRKMSKEDLELSNMGTTLLCFLVNSQFKLFASVGDSRIYAYNSRELIQLSEDQTFANALLKAGYINQKEAQIHPKKNLLLCAMGSNDEDLDVQIKEIVGKYNYLLCSDGLYNMINSKEILKILSSDKDLDAKVEELIVKANENGGKDNVSVILVEECL